MITEEELLDIFDFFNVGYINYDNKNQVEFVRKRMAKAIINKLTEDEL